MKCECLTLKDPWERVERVTGRQSGCARPWPVLSHEQGLLQKSTAMAAPVLLGSPRGMMAVGVLNAWGSPVSLSFGLKDERLVSGLVTCCVILPRVISSLSLGPLICKTDVFCPTIFHAGLFEGLA